MSPQWSGMTLWFGDNESSDEEEDPEVVSRKEWGARPAMRIREFPEPASNAVYTETETKECKTKKECMKIVREIQSYHMDVRGLPDIQFHFLIGGDGNIYEGRGWDCVGLINPRDTTFPEEMHGGVVEIAFIGQFTEKGPPKSMVNLASKLLRMGVDSNKLLLTKKSDEITQEDVEELRRQGYQVDIQGYVEDEEKQKEEKEGKVGESHTNTQTKI